MEELASQVYKRSTANDPKIHKIHRILGKYIIVLSNELHPIEDTWYTQELQSNGDILLRKIEN